MIKVGVAGGGYWGKNLIRNFYELGALTTICDSNKSLENIYKEKYPKVSFEGDYNKLVSSDVDAIVIATPAEQHYKMAMWAILHGKDVFVEKPLSLNKIEGNKLVTYAKINDKVLMVGHILQYHNAIKTIRKMIDDNILGTLRYVYSNRLNFGKIRTEEDILFSFAPHDVSVILMLLNDFPISIYTTGGNYLQKNIADVTMSTLDFNNNIKAHLFISWINPYKEQKLVVVGEKGLVVFDDTIDDKLVLYNHKVNWNNNVPVVSKAKGEVINIEKSEPLKNECQHFIDCVESRNKPITDGMEGLGVLKLLTLCEQSLKENKILKQGKDY